MVLLFHETLGAFSSQRPQTGRGTDVSLGGKRADPAPHTPPMWSPLGSPPCFPTHLQALPAPFPMPGTPSPDSLGHRQDFLRSHLFHEAFQDLPALPRALSTLTTCLPTMKPRCSPSGLMFPLSLMQAGHMTYSSATELGDLLCRPCPQSGDEVPGSMQPLEDRILLCFPKGSYEGSAHPWQ